MNGAPAPARGDGLSADIARLAVRGAAWAALAWLLRALEFAAVRSTHAAFAGAGATELAGALADVRYAVVVTLLLGAVALPLGRWAPRAGALAQHGTFAVLAAVAVALSRYYAVTGVLLGADLFGYSFADVTTAASASAGAGWTGWVTLGAAVVASCLATGPLAARLVPAAARRGIRLAAACVVAAAFLAGAASLGDGSEESAALAANKSAYFVARAAEHAAEGGNDFAGLPPYPLYRPDDTPDVLGPLLAPSATPPNLALIIVEGLGRDFVGDDARWRGFTPFLDSLASQSLSWDNALSATGRTFGAVPALLGSLPTGDAGFMALRNAMPPHRSLIQLLRERGYLTRFVTGTSARFDDTDIFLERQEVDRLIDEGDFRAPYAREPATAAGFSWGFPDDALFRHGLETVPAGRGQPRLDVYQTITTHEPFVPPDSARWAAAFDARLGRLPAAERDRYRPYANVFATLLYTDDAIRRFFDSARRDPAFANTIVIVTGDHRLVPVPEGERIDRFRVPLIVASPLVRRPRRFPAVVSHLDLTPTLVAFLRARHHLAFPDSAAWLGTALDTAPDFRVATPRALVRTKNDAGAWVAGGRFLDGGRLARVTPALGLVPEHDAARRDSMAAALAQSRRLDRYLTRGSHLYPPGAAPAGAGTAGDSLWRALGLAHVTPESAFAVARGVAFARDYARARTLLRRLLRDAPSYHDARALLGRTFGWENAFDSARVVLDDLARRAPNYEDGIVARADLERWAGRPARARAIADSGLKRFPGDTALRRVLRQLDGARP